MTAAVPGPRFRDQLAGWLAEHVFCTGEYGDGWTTPREESYSCSCGVEFGEWIQGRDDSTDWDPNQDWREHVAAEVEARVQAAANQRAVAIDVEHLERQREWSQATFGPGDRRKGVIDHIRKELVEIEEAGERTDEWFDVVILALDGAWRDGHEAAEIIAAIKAKQAKNERRTWPDWRTADPDRAIEHVRAAVLAQPAPGGER